MYGMIIALSINSITLAIVYTKVTNSLIVAIPLSAMLFALAGLVICGIIKVIRKGF